MGIKILLLGIVIKFEIAVQTTQLQSFQGIGCFKKLTGGGKDERTLDLPLGHTITITALPCNLQVGIDQTHRQFAVEREAFVVDTTVELIEFLHIAQASLHNLHLLQAMTFLLVDMLTLLHNRVQTLKPAFRLAIIRVTLPSQERSDEQRHEKYNPLVPHWCALVFIRRCEDTNIFRVVQIFWFIFCKI